MVVVVGVVVVAGGGWRSAVVVVAAAATVAVVAVAVVGEHAWCVGTSGGRCGPPLARGQARTCTRSPWLVGVRSSTSPRLASEKVTSKEEEGGKAVSTARSDSGGGREAAMTKHAKRLKSVRRPGATIMASQ